MSGFKASKNTTGTAWDFPEQPQADDLSFAKGTSLGSLRLHQGILLYELKVSANTIQ